MLDLGEYLLGVLEVLLLGGFAWLGGAAVRARLLPRFEEAPAHLASAVIALALLIWAAELLGSLGWWDPVAVPACWSLRLGSGSGGSFRGRPRGRGAAPHPPRQVRVGAAPLPTLVALMRG